MENRPHIDDLPVQSGYFPSLCEITKCYPKSNEIASWIILVYSLRFCTTNPSEFAKGKCQLCTARKKIQWPFRGSYRSYITRSGAHINIFWNLAEALEILRKATKNLLAKNGALILLSQPRQRGDAAIAGAKGFQKHVYNCQKKKGNTNDCDFWPENRGQTCFRNSRNKIEYT